MNGDSMENGERERIAREKRTLNDGLTSEGVNVDVMNAWSGCADLAQSKGVLTEETLPPLLTYEQNYRKSKYSLEAASHLIQESNPEGVARYDAVVERFNSDRSRIIREQDWNAVIRFFNEASKVVRGSGTSVLLREHQ